VADLVDPLGGSYAVESLTDQIEAGAADYIRRIDDMGGMVAAIEQKFPQSQIERRAYEYQRSIESKQRIVVGVNDFVMKEPPVRGLHHLDPQAEADRVSEIRALRAARDEQKTQESLRALSEKASQPAASDITRAEFKANPFPYYAQLREHQPVMRARMGRLEGWLLTRYDDVQAALKDPRLVKNVNAVAGAKEQSKRPWMPAFLRALENNMLDQDNPNHARLRALVHRAFTPARVEQLHSRIEALANELLDAQQSRGELELIRDFALPLPLTVIGELLGISAAGARALCALGEKCAAASDYFQCAADVASDVGAVALCAGAFGAAEAAAARRPPNGAGAGRGSRRPLTVRTSRWRWCCCC
jgi:hypothetical protein